MEKASYDQVLPVARSWEPGAGVETASNSSALFSNPITGSSQGQGRRAGPSPGPTGARGGEGRRLRSSCPLGFQKTPGPGSKSSTWLVVRERFCAC